MQLNACLRVNNLLDQQLSAHYCSLTVYSTQTEIKHHPPLQRGCIRLQNQVCTLTTQGQSEGHRTVQSSTRPLPCICAKSSRGCSIKQEAGQGCVDVVIGLAI